MKKSFLLLLLVPFWVIVSCNDDKNDDPQPSGKVDDITLKANSFISQVMQAYYLWNRDLKEYDIRYEADPAAYFEKLKVAEDKWSYISDKGEEFLKSMEGVEKTLGFEYSFFYLDATHKGLGVCVEYVYPHTPAAEKNINRGDVILAINNQTIDLTNYEDLNASLQSGENVTLAVCKIDPLTGEFSAPSEVEVTAKVANLDPVHTVKVIEEDNKKIGYLFYTSFVGNFNASLDEAFNQFRNAGVSELILDLRYNSGGDDKAIVCLCSHIARRTAVSQNKVFLMDQFNEDYIHFLEARGEIESTRIRFDSELSEANLDLKRVFILTGEYTASASEATIIGLKPYLEEVICIGEKTYGKYTSMFQLVPNDKDIDNWILLPVVAKYVNVEGASCKGGIAPDYEEEVFSFPLKPLGDTEDPLVAKAIELITHTPAITARKTKTAFPGSKLVPGGFSRHNDIRSNLIHR